MAGVPPDPQSRAAFVRLTTRDSGRDLIDVKGPGLTAFQRVLQTLGGMQDVSGVTISVDKVIQFGGLLIDATKAPFRVNGRKWSIGFDLAAPGADSNIVTIQNKPSGQPQAPNPGLALVVIDELRYQGPSVLSLDSQFLSNLAESPANARDVEQPITTQQGGVVLFKNSMVQVSGLATVGPYGAPPASRMGFMGNVAVGSPSEVYNPDGLVLWPGEMMVAVQVTALKTMTLTVSGRVWLFTRKEA